MQTCEWQPIETAPKDGDLFLVYVPDDIPFMTTGYCMDDGYFIPMVGEGDYEPTHWRPLPSPPKGASV